jgi:hypothetical protein
MGAQRSMREINMKITRYFILQLTQRRPKCRERNNIKIVLREISFNHVDLIQLARYRIHCRIFQHDNEI